MVVAQVKIMAVPTAKQQVWNPGGFMSLQAWVQKTGVELVQVNGQRKYGGPPPGWSGPEPGSGCEVYISQIPRDIFENHLIPLFQSVAPLYEFRLMMNFSGQNRGFAYAKYGNAHGASVAVQKLHRHELRAGARLVVRRSTEKRQLLLGELPVHLQQERLLQVLRNLSDGVETVSLMSAKDEKRTTAVVQYYSHHAASMAKKVLCEAFQKTFAIHVTVKWMTLPSKPEQDVDQKTSTPSRQPCCRPWPLAASLLDCDQEAAVVPLSQAAHLGREGPGIINAVTLLKKVCRFLGLGLPHYRAQYCHTGPDGFLYFSFKVEIPGLPLPFTGTTRILPGSNAGATVAEVHQAAAEHVFKACYMA